MTKRIILMGANGQVGAEVTLRLAPLKGVTLTPLARSRGGSAFLRYNGVAVAHADIAKKSDAIRALATADVIANFALPIGNASIEQDRQLLDNMFEAAPPTAKIIFFSTASVHGAYDAAGKKVRNAYQHMKLQSERFALRAASRSGHAAWVLRLGHVAGDMQNITRLVRSEIKAGPVVIPDPNRASNLTHTVTIADAIMAVAEGRAGPPGVYELLNHPNWTWREVYEHEAAVLGLTLQLTAGGPATAARRSGLRSAVIGMAHRLGLKEKGLVVLSSLPSMANAVRQDHLANQARAEIGRLAPPAPIANTALLWPELPSNPLPGLRSAHDLFRENVYPLTSPAAQARWPADLLAS